MIDFVYHIDFSEKYIYEHHIADEMTNKLKQYIETLYDDDSFWYIEEGIHQVNIQLPCLKIPDYVSLTTKSVNDDFHKILDTIDIELKIIENRYHEYAYKVISMSFNHFIIENIKDILKKANMNFKIYKFEKDFMVDIGYKENNETHRKVLFNLKLMASHVEEY